MPVMDESMIEEIEIDPETGLPVLPEGQFWRVGVRELPKDAHRFYSYWGDFEDTHYGEGVFLMGPEVPVTKYRTRPVYGTGFSRNKVVRYDDESYGAWEEEVIDFRSFAAFQAKSREEIPGFGVFHSYIEGSDGPCFFRVPLSDEGIAFAATWIIARRLEAVRHQKEASDNARKAREARDKYYGDYPPKKLEKD